ncbi:hypothetical protein YYC_01823 [Plasmodium yoelii 17X]|uniref:Fam-c protein n=1 Tax=Plasmodium yoelii 17X TaxID=1323249 RepID=V7PSK0_PLAYE|nr:hypothetical protein YYC_01823 [Plasmodium yoelii 17X]
MNKKIYSLAAVYSYILFIVTIQCFTNNEDLNKYVKKNENVHDEYEINSIDINNNGKFRYRSLSEHNTEDKQSLDSNANQEPSDNKRPKNKEERYHSPIYYKYYMVTDEENKPQKSKKSRFPSMFKRHKKDKTDKDSNESQESLDDDDDDDNKSLKSLDDDSDDNNKSQKPKKSRFPSMFKKDKKDKDANGSQESLNVDKSLESRFPSMFKKDKKDKDDDDLQEFLIVDKSLEILNDDSKSQKPKRSTFPRMFKRDKKDQDGDKSQESLNVDKSLESLNVDKSLESLDDDNTAQKSKRSRFPTMFKRDKKDEKPSYGKVTVSYPNDKTPEIFSNNKEKNPPIVVKLENITINVDQTNSEHLSFLSCLNKITQEQGQNNKASK